MADKKTINIICKYSSLYSGNFIPSVLAFAKKAQEYYRIIFSFPIEVKNRTWVSSIQEEGFSIYYYTNTSNRTLIKSLKKINKLNSVDLVYSHFLSSFVIKMLSPISRRLKIVIHIHSDFSLGKNGNLIKRIFKKIFEKIIRNDATKIYVYEDFDKGKNSFYVRNALCLDRFKNLKYDCAEIKSKYGINKKETVFLTFGWSPEVKGVDITVKAFLKMINNSHSGNSPKLLIVCDDGGIEKCKDFLLGRIDYNQNEEDNILFLEPNQHVENFYLISDVFVSSSRSEGFSYSILEALYFGLNVFSSNIKGTTWSEKYGSKLFESCNYEELSELMKSSLLNRNKKIINEKIANDFSISAWSNRVLTIIKDIK